MSRSALVRTAALSLVTLLAGCGKEEGPPPSPQVPPPVAAYVPPPLPDPPTAPWCARPAEAAAFSVAALKSNLMVTAISCKSEEKYNAFITRYRPSLVQQEKTTESYFSRNDRRRWQQTRDDYITQLANAQSQRAMVLGDKFCELSLARFDAVMALSRPEDLPDFAAATTQSIPQPMKFTECPPPGQPTPTPKTKK